MVPLDEKETIWDIAGRDDLPTTHKWLLHYGLLDKMTNRKLSIIVYICTERKILILKQGMRTRLNFE